MASRPKRVVPGRIRSRVESFVPLLHRKRQPPRVAPYLSPKSHRQRCRTCHRPSFGRLTVRRRTSQAGPGPASVHQLFVRAILLLLQAVENPCRYRIHTWLDRPRVLCRQSSLAPTSHGLYLCRQARREYRMVAPFRGSAWVVSLNRDRCALAPLKPRLGPHSNRAYAPVPRKARLYRAGPYP